MPRHYMIDIETWDTAPTAVIRAIAVVGFDLDGATKELFVIDCRHTVDEQIQAGRTTSVETAKWWAGQRIPLDAALAQTREIANTDVYMPSNLAVLLENLWFATHNVDADTRVWSRGHFDIAILEHLLASSGKPIPWRHSQVRDVRTLNELVPPVKAALPHHPLSDCLAQIQQVCAALKLAPAAMHDPNITSHSKERHNA